MGWRAFDTAEMYGEGGAESLLGEALAPALRGELSREQLFVVSKVYPHNASARGVLAACERSLRRLQLEHIDLYLLHWRGNVPLHETVAGFEQLQQRGLIRHWGVSNFDREHLLDLVDVPGGAACSANQVWYSLSRRGVEFDLLPWQRSRQMPLMAYSPIDQGALLAAAPLRELARQRGVSPAQVALAWLLHQPGRDGAAEVRTRAAPATELGRRAAEARRGRTRSAGSGLPAAAGQAAAGRGLRPIGRGALADPWHLPQDQTLTTSPFSDHRMPSTSLRVPGSMSWACSAAIASSMTATNSCSLMFMPRCVLSMSCPL